MTRSIWSTVVLVELVEVVLVLELLVLELEEELTVRDVLKEKG